MSDFRVYDKIKSQVETGDGTSDYFVNIALRNNGIVSDYAFQMLNLACALEDTLPELTLDNKRLYPEVSQNQNIMFRQFRSCLRFVFYATAIQIRVNKPTKEDLEVIRQLESYLNQPYGKYPINKITAPAINYFEILVHKGIVPIVLGYSEKSGISKFNQG